MPLRVGNITLYMGPHTLGAPDDLEKAIVTFIDGAKKRLLIAVQELDNETIARAIVRARQRKCVVKLVLEGDYLKSPRTRADPWEANGRHEVNRHLAAACLRANIWVRQDYNAHIFHQKFVVRDGKDVLTGSTNFTVTGVTRNLNHLVVIRDPKVAKIYTREFKEISQGKFGKQAEGIDPAPKDRMVSNVAVRVAFAPDHAPEMEIMKQMLKARSRVDFAIFTFSKSSGIDDTMIRLTKDPDMVVRGVLDGKQANQSWAATRPIENAGAELHVVKSKGKLGKLHHKLMVIDESVVIVGSFNYTGPANKLNDENIMVLGDIETAVPKQREAQRKLAAYAKDEIDRIIATHATAL